MTRKVDPESFQKETIGIGHFNFNLSGLPSSILATVGTESFQKTYSLDGTTLGEGGNGRVYGGVRIKDGLPIAIKHVLRRRVTKWFLLGDVYPSIDPYDLISIVQIPLEVYLLLKVAHIEGVIRILDYFVQTDSFIIIMENPGPPVKDLFEFISSQKYKFLHERPARNFFRQVVETVGKVHAAGVIHRDIKCENILVAEKSRMLKLIDFGSGAILKKEPYTDFLGTAVYAAPEMLKERKYDGLEATVWSLGILLFDMVSGHVPFKRKDEILKGDIQFKRNLTPECKALIKACLNLNPKERPTLERILEHPWMRNKKET